MGSIFHLFSQIFTCRATYIQGRLYELLTRWTSLSVFRFVYKSVCSENDENTSLVNIGSE